MDTHELAAMLLERPPKNVGVSVDLSTSDENVGHRVFSSDLYSFQEHGKDLVLLFECGVDNEDR